MRSRIPLWLWFLSWGTITLAGLGIWVLYARLPADGASGGLEAFAPQGFRVEWLLQGRPDGLQVEDLVVRGGGHTADEWLGGAPRGPEWRSGGTVTYEIERDGQALVLPIRLAPIPLAAILSRWWAQLAVSAALLVMSGFVLWKRPEELAARVLMLFCLTVAVQLWGDAYNFQFAALPWRWAFWFHLLVEHLTFTLSYASICHFALIFPAPHPLVARFPVWTPLVLYLSNPLAIVVTMALSPTASQALAAGNRVSLLVVLLQLGLAFVGGIRALRTARDPVSRAQMRWILWAVGVAFAVAIPGYILPLALAGRPFIPNPVMMLLTVLIPYVLGVSILRYRLFDIEVIINRTLVFGTLTILLGGLYVLAVRLLTLLVQAVLQRPNDTLVTFIAALSIALAFDPLRRRVQAVIDHTFYRTKLDSQRLLAEMSERLVTSVVLTELAALLTEELPRRLQIAWATLAVPDRAGDRFVPAGPYGGHPPLPANHPLVATLHRLGRPLLYLQPPAHLPAEAQAYLDRHGIELSIPLMVGTDLVGLYSLGPKLSGQTFTQDETHLLYILGQQAAIAVENSRLFQAEREQRHLAEALQKAADAVSSTLDLDQVLDRILEQVEQVVTGDAFNMMLVEGDLARVVRWRGYEELGLAERMASFSAPIAGFPTLAQMMRTGMPIVVSDTETDPDWMPLEGWEWLRSYMSAPIQVAGQTVGFLNVDRTRPGQFNPADARRLEAFARHAATALEHARLYEQAQQEIAERRRAEAQIKASLEEKEMLLKEIHHRVKNNLQVISSLLYLQSKQVEDGETLRAFQESQLRVRSMALVHERLYRTPDLARVDLGEYIRDLAGYLMRSYGVTPSLVKLRIDVHGVALGIDTAVPCGLIVSELISNSLKHAFPDGREGEITVALRSDPNGRCTLLVRDDGVGLPKGLDLETVGSLGLRLVNRLVNQLDGTVELDGSQGTRFEIRFRDPEHKGVDHDKGTDTGG